MTQLFEGQTTHPLNEAEKKAFFDKIDFDGEWFSFGDEKAMRHALEAIIQTPTGAHQAREIIKNNPPITIKTVSDSQKGETGWYSPKTGKITLLSNNLNQPLKSGATLLHELLHARQKIGNLNENRLLADSETQALSAQLEYETTPKSDISYKKSYNIILKKWRQIAQNPQKTPKGIMPFKPLPNAPLQEAQEAYAHQMASLEMQALFVRDFLKTTKEQGANTALPVASYELRAMQGRYLQEMATGEEHFTATPNFINDILSRNPFLTHKDFKPLQKRSPAKSEDELEEFQWPYTNHQEPLLKTLSDINKTQDILLDSKHPQHKKFLENLKTVLKKDNHPYINGKNGLMKKIQNQKPLSDEEKILLRFVIIKSSVNPKDNIGRYFLNTIIIRHQQLKPHPNPVRRYLIKEIEKLTGEKQPMVQQNNTHLKNTLRNASGTDINTETPTPVHSTGREGMV